MLASAPGASDRVSRPAVSFPKGTDSASKGAGSLPERADRPFDGD
jgi:hypothetical protein